MKEFLKEPGKFALDLSKIMFAIALITPLVKGMGVNAYFATATILTASAGLYLIYKGAKDEC